MARTHPGKAILCVMLFVLFLSIQGCFGPTDETDVGQPTSIGQSTSKVYHSLYVTSDAGGRIISDGRYTSYSSVGEAVAGGRSTCAGYSAYHGFSAGLVEPAATNETDDDTVIPVTEKMARVDKPE